MDQNLEKQYENYFSMFVTEGWKQFIEDMQDIYDNYRIEDIKDQDQLSLVQGERRILSQILRFEDGIKSHYHILKEESNA